MLEATETTEVERGQQKPKNKVTEESLCSRVEAVIRLAKPLDVNKDKQMQLREIERKTLIVITAEAPLNKTEIKSQAVAVQVD